jgi:hypothetical protein
MTKGMSKKEQRADLRRKRDKAAAGLALGGKSPPRGIPIPSAAPRPPSGLAPSHYPYLAGVRTRKARAEP